MQSQPKSEGLSSVSNERPQRRGSAKERDPRSKAAKKRRTSSAFGLGKNPSSGDSNKNSADNSVPLTHWEAFQEHLRLIDDNTGMYSTGKDANSPRKPGEGDTAETEKPAADVTPEQTVEQQAKQITASIKGRSSDAFSKVMYEFQLKKQQHIERLAAIQRERERRAQEEQATREAGAGGTAAAAAAEEDAETAGDEDFDPDWSDDDEVDQFQNTAVLELRKSAARAWGIIRRHIQEIKMEKKNVGSTMNWNFLRQTLGNMTDMEKGRQNLYERYLQKPDTWKEGFVNFPEELFDKEKPKPGQRGYVLPVNTHSRRRRSQQPRNEAQSHRNKAIPSH